jgi:hypothetical protein
MRMVGLCLLLHLDFEVEMNALTHGFKKTQRVGGC